MREADPERALARRRGMVLDERGFIRGHCRRVVLRRASHSHSHNHRAEIGSLVFLGSIQFLGVFVYLQNRKANTDRHPGDSEVVYEYMKLLWAGIQLRRSRKKKKKSPNETLAVVWQTRRKPIVYEHMNHHR